MDKLILILPGKHSALYSVPERVIAEWHHQCLFPPLPPMDCWRWDFGSCHIPLHKGILMDAGAERLLFEITVKLMLSLVDVLR